MAIVRKINIVLKSKPYRVAFFIAVMQAIADAMLAHTVIFVATPVDLTAFKKQIDDLVAKQAAARKRVPGAAALRDEALRVVAASAELLRAYVEQLCNESPEQAVSIAQAASMQISAVPVRAKVPLWALQGPHAGVVNVFASVALLVTGKGGRFFNWSYSTDGGKTWLAAGSTPKARTTISGLPILAESLFRVSVTDSNGSQGPWSDAITFLVH